MLRFFLFNIEWFIFDLIIWLYMIFFRSIRIKDLNYIRWMVCKNSLENLFNIDVFCCKLCVKYINDWIVYNYKLSLLYWIWEII